MEQQRYEKGTWHGKPTWNCLGCHGTFFSEEEWEAHWNANHVKEVTLRPTGLVDPKGREIVVEEDGELEEWRERALAAKAAASSFSTSDEGAKQEVDDEPLAQPVIRSSTVFAGIDIRKAQPLEIDDDE